MPLSHRLSRAPRTVRSPGRVARRCVVVAGLLAAVAATGCTASGTGGSGGGSGSGGSTAPADSGTGLPALRWRPCSLAGVAVRCAELRVPVDYAHPGGRTLTLALSMVPATAPPGQRQGYLLVNPGGPGVSGRGLAVDVAYGLDHSVASQYNIVGFDPRGVGASVPALHCDPSFFKGVRPDYVPASARAEAVLEARARMYAADCQRRYGWLLPFMTTKDAARDMDAIRAALGVKKISYFGYSYGTYLGQVYATLFPQRVRRMVLDSTVDPTGAWYADNIAQDYGFQGRLLAFFSWVAAHNSVYRLGTTRAQVDAAWYRARRDLAAHPVAGPHGPAIGPDEYDDTFEYGGYTDTVWPALATALSAYLHTGTSRQLAADFGAFGAQNENLFAVYNAVECSDAAWPRSWARWNADARRVYRTAPFQAWDNTWFNAACAFWPVRGPARPLAIRGTGLPGILMIQGTLDAATPYAGAQAAHRLLPSARMVVVEGGGNHGQSLSQVFGGPPNTCVNGYLNRYLATGALPGGRGAVNATCPALPPPSPTG